MARVDALLLITSLSISGNIRELCIPLVKQQAGDVAGRYNTTPKLHLHQRQLGKVHPCC